jgi:hypothetical protein
MTQGNEIFFIFVLMGGLRGEGALTQDLRPLKIIF